jgi:hypothetical protein
MDLKPENLLVHEGKVKVADFGLSRDLGHLSMASPELLRDGVGTPQYMSPEQIQAAHRRDVRGQADIYALGCVLCELLTGDVPFDPPKEKILEVHRAGERPRWIADHLADPYRGAVYACIETKPENRPQGVSELLAILEGRGSSPDSTGRQSSSQDQLIQSGSGLTSSGAGGYGLHLVSGGGPLRFGRLGYNEQGCQELLAWPSRIDVVTIDGKRRGKGGGRVSRMPKTMRPFMIGKYPVTVEEYRRYLNAHGKELPLAPRLLSPEWGWDNYNPMVYVSYHEAAQFCMWAGGRLPTRDEWEYAADVGGQADLLAQGWLLENSQGRTQPVGGKLPNVFGLCDTIGNVWEWCTDAQGVDSVVCGGGWSSRASDLRVSHFRTENNGLHVSTIGFRLVIPESRTSAPKTMVCM